MKRQPGNTGRLNINLCYVENYRVAQNTNDHFKKTWLSLKGISLFGSNFCANLDETNADMVQSRKRWN